MDLKKDWWKILTGVWISGVIIAAFSENVLLIKGLGQTTRVLFFHVPCSWVATIAYGSAAFYGIRYLQKEDIRYDLKAYAAAQIGFLFTVLASVTGAVWANEIWGHPWNWDPRQTSIFILMLIYAAYFALRSAIEEEEKRARLAAVYAIIGALSTIFFMYIAPRLYETLHPDPLINQQGKIKMDSNLLNLFLSSFFGFSLLYLWMHSLKVQVLQLSRKLLIKRINDEG